MKRWALIALLPLIAASTSCQKAQDEDTSLSFSIGPSSPYVLPIGLTSCKGKSTGSGTADLAANTVEFTRFKYTWSGSGTYTMSAILLRFTSSIFTSGKYECTLAGDELELILPVGGGVVAPGTAELSARCTLKCGGIAVSSGVTSALIPGVVKIIGIETDSNGDSRPVVVQSDITMTYQKF